MKHWWPYSILTGLSIAVNVLVIVWIAWTVPSWFHVALLAFNVLAIYAMVYSRRRMRKLHEAYVARERAFRRRLAHARQRGDTGDERLTLQLMAIWKMKPPDQDGEA